MPLLRRHIGLDAAPPRPMDSSRSQVEVPGDLHQSWVPRLNLTRNPFKRLASPFREFGPRVGALYLANRALGKLWSGLRVVQYDLMAQPVSPEPLLTTVHARQVRYAEIGRGSPELALMPPPEAVKAARFDQGARCIVVYQRQRFVGYAWFCFERYREDEVRCDFKLADPMGSSFDFDVYVFPEYRLGRAFAAVWHSANEFLRAEGVTYTFSRIAAINLASARAHARLGAVRVGQAVYICVGRFQFAVVSSQEGRLLSLTSRRSLEVLLAAPPVG